jgi:hypothetical protein
MEFRIECHLAYEVVGSSSFLFNVAAVHNSLQGVITEQLTVTGAELPGELLSPPPQYAEGPISNYPSGNTTGAS